MRSVDCPDCGAIHAKRVRFCEECGAPLEEVERKERRREDSEERRDAYRTLLRAQRSIRFVRVVFTLLAVIYGFTFLLLVSAFANGDQALTEGASSTGAVLVVLGITGALLGVAIVGAVDVRRRPFLWATVLAAFQSLNVLVATLTGPPPVFGYLFALGLWVFVVPTARMRRLLAEHPDLSISRRLRGERAARGSVGERAHERRRELASQRNRRLALGLAIAAGLAALYLGASWLRRPPTAESALASFVADWNARGPAVAATAVLDRGAATDLVADFGVLVSERGWRAGAPSLGPGEPYERPAQNVVIARHTLGGDELVTKWRRDDDRWLLFGLRPPFGEEDERFRAAWNRSRIADVAAFFRRSEKIADSLRRISEQRGWSELPDLDEALVEETALHRRTATFPSAEGPLEVKFRHEGARWSAVGLKPPPRR